MITEEQQERASLYALGALDPEERLGFEAQMQSNPELLELALDLQRTANSLLLVGPKPELPATLKNKVMAQVERASKPAAPNIAAISAGLRFLEAAGQSGWKQLPIPGAYIKLLSLERERGYAVLLGKLDRGVRYPAHVNAGPEDFYVLSGDLVVGERKLVAGDFHHAEAGSQHGVNYSIEGCTLLAVLTTDDPLVAFAMA